MKKLFTFILLGATTVAFAQKDNVGIGTTQPDQSAILDLSSSSKGFLTPRMTQVQRDLILSPAQGLQIFQTDEMAGLYVFDGQKWVNSTAGTSAAIDPWVGGGNAAAATDFIGTTNPQPLRFKVQNTNAGLIGLFGTKTVFFGYEAGLNNTGTSNVGLGYRSLWVASGANNAALGSEALRANTTGYSNTAVGSFALTKNTDGYLNVGVGSNALADLTTGDENFGLGGAAMRKMVSGDHNIAIGTFSLSNNTTGSRNTVIGRQAGLNSTGSGNLFIGYQAGFGETASDDKLYISNSSTTTPLIYGDFSAKYVTIGDVPATALKRSTAAAAGYNLLVKGGILTEKVKVALTASADWADYVFEKEYKDNMLSLEEVEKFTLAHKHLPNVPSAQDMVENGLEIGQTSKMFMEKIEELTLYMIEMNKEIKALKAENEQLKTK